MAPVFDTTIMSHGGTTAGIAVPESVLTELGGGRRPAVLVRLDGYTYRSTVAVMGGEILIGVSNKIRAESGLAVGDTVRVELTLDTEPRVITPPDDLVAAMDAAPGARVAWDALSYSNQRRHAEAIEAAKKPETRERRVIRTVDEVLGR